MSELVNKLPKEAGVYLFKDGKGQVLYVGKAVNIKNRVKSYFQKKPSSDKVRLLVSQIRNIDFIRVDLEIEALLLEANLIKKYQPFFNHQLKDDKDYLYILITNEDFPRVLTGRKRDLEKVKTYFGPFPSAAAARSALKVVRRVYPFRTNCKPFRQNNSKSLVGRSNPKRACLAYHIGLCPGVCVGAISQTDYKKLIKKIIKFLNGDTKSILNDLEKQMKDHSDNLEFEEAAKIRYKIESIRKITQPLEQIENYLQGPEILESKYRRQLESFQRDLNLSLKPERIECYDISNIQGTNSVGSMVVLKNGQISKDDYRRFRIKTIKGINDPASMAEVLRRRFHNDWPKPDLIVVDGGKTQLNAAVGVLEEVRLKIPIIGLAKRNEEIHLPGKRETLKLAKNSESLYLIQRIRDEAHRFAITYHRKLRSKQFLPT